jgi:hypothetical protein
MEFVVTVLMACAAFAFCFAVFLFKARKEEGGGRLHACGQDSECRCRKQNPALYMLESQTKCCRTHGEDRDRTTSHEKVDDLP